MTLDVGDVQLVSGSVEHQRSRKPTDRNQSREFRFAVGRIEIHNRDRVLCPVGHVEASSRRIKDQRIRRGAEQVRGLGLDPDGLDDAVGAGVDGGECVTARIRTDDIMVVGRNGERAGVESGEECRRGRGSGEITGVRPPAAPVRDVGLLAHQDYVIGSNADRHRSKHLSGGGVDFQECVGKVSADKESLSVQSIGRCSTTCGHRRCWAARLPGSSRSHRGTEFALHAGRPRVGLCHRSVTFGASRGSGRSGKKSPACFFWRRRRWSRRRPG